MTAIKDLKWKDHPAGMGGERATVEFGNGYTASVLRGGPFYTTNGSYEIAVMSDGWLDYSTPITDDTLGYPTEDEANKALSDIEALPALAGAK